MDASQHVMVAFDGRRMSEMALHRAFRMVEHSAFAMIHVVTVAEELDGGIVRLASGELLNRWAALDSLRLRVDALLPRESRNSGLRVIVHLRGGEAARSLVDFAYRYHVDQIVVGARSSEHGLPDRVGSVARGILNLTDIPTHLESAMASAPPSSPPNAMRWAYVFGGRHLNADAFLREDSRPSA